MKQKSNEIKRLFQFMGKHRTLLNVSRFLSGISALFIMCPFLCVYFAARDLVSIFAGKPIDTGSCNYSEPPLFKDEIRMT